MSNMCHLVCEIRSERFCFEQNQMRYYESNIICDRFEPVFIFSELLFYE